MNKEKLITFSKAQYSQHMTKALEEFFSQNVVIPKGKNRHKDADVLHEWAENTTKIIEIATHYMDNRGRDEYIFDRTFTIPTNPLRIKPSEPVWGWQYLLIGKDSNSLSTKFYTDDEFNDSLFVQKAVKLEDTKRERK